MLTRRATAYIAVPLRKLSQSISIHFVSIHSSATENRKKLLKPLFFDLRSFKVIYVDTIKKQVTSACYNNV